MSCESVHRRQVTGRQAPDLTLLCPFCSCPPGFSAHTHARPHTWRHSPRTRTPNAARSEGFGMQHPQGCPQDWRPNRGVEVEGGRAKEMTTIPLP